MIDERPGPSCGQVSCFCGWPGPGDDLDWEKHLVANGYGALDAAWAEAEAALPEGWLFRIGRNTATQFDPQLVVNFSYRAFAYRSGSEAEGFGANADTPAAALRALASKLRERAG